MYREFRSLIVSLAALIPACNFVSHNCITDIIDESNCSCGLKFNVLIVSDDFSGKSLIERHRMVNSILEEELKKIHAFSQKTLTVKQWKEKNAN